MDMTISMFNAHMMRLPAVRARWMMEGAQASFYAHPNIKDDARAKIWNAWTGTIAKITHAINMIDSADAAARALFTWNGEPVTKDVLRQQLDRLFGRKVRR